MDADVDEEVDERHVHVDVGVCAAAGPLVSVDVCDVAIGQASAAVGILALLRADLSWIVGSWRRRF